MKFLQICQKPPLPLTDGGCIAFHALTMGLIQAGHNVKVFTLFTDKHDFMPESMPEEYVQKTDIEGVYVDTNMNLVDVYSNFMTRDPYNLSRFFSVDVDIRLTRLLQKEKYDCIILESIFTTPYLPTIRRNVNTKVVLRSHNVEHQIWDKLAKGEKNFFKRIYLSYLSKKLYKAEIEAWRSVDGVACISYDDLQFTRALSKKPAYLLPVAMPTQRSVEMHGHELKVYHIGSMDWMPNLEAINGFIENTLPTVIKEFPSFEFHIGGRKMPASIHNKKIPGIVSWGEVESAETFARNFQIMLVPLQSGSGIRIKILEAFAMGMAVISTEQGIRGIDVEDRKEYYKAESPEEWVEALRALQNPRERARIGKNAQSFMEDSYSNLKIIHPLVQFIKALPKR
ncbi:MAG: glycosyltransferase family 4 protein [Bacteroidota bacterium]